MKRFLSILLASMMILGCMAVTVSADAPTITLETGDTLAALATDPTVDAGRRVMVNKIVGATYYRNGVIIPSADIVDGPKADTVALPVIEGGNVFQLVANGEVSSNYVYVKGTNHTIDDEGSGEFDVTTADYLKMTEVTDSAVLALINPDNSRTTIGKNYYGYRGANRNDLDNMLSDTTGVEAADKAVLSTDCYIKDLSGVNLDKGAFALGVATKGKVSGTNKYTLGGIGVNADRSLYIAYDADGGSYARSNIKGTTVDTGVSTTFDRWNNYAAVVYESTATVDYYFNNVLIAKSMTTRSDYDAGSFQGASFSGGGISVKTTDAASYFYFDNMIGETTAISAAVSANPTEPTTTIDPDAGQDPILPNVFSGAVRATVNAGGVGVVEFNNALLEENEASIIVVKNDNTIERKVYTKGVDATTQTFTNVKKLFVWKWGTMVPLCYAVTVK